MRSTLLQLPLRGALRAFLGGPLVRLFFVFKPKFSTSKRAPETKASEYIWFQTMRNPMVFTSFSWDHGVYPTTTTFWLIFVTFWSQNMKSEDNQKPEGLQTKLNQILLHRDVQGDIKHIIFGAAWKMKISAPEARSVNEKHRKYAPALRCRAILRIII